MSYRSKQKLQFRVYSCPSTGFSLGTTALLQNRVNFWLERVHFDGVDAVGKSVGKLLCDHLESSVFPQPLEVQVRPGCRRICCVDFWFSVFFAEDILFEDDAAARRPVEGSSGTLEKLRLGSCKGPNVRSSSETLAGKSTVVSCLQSPHQGGKLHTTAPRSTTIASLPQSRMSALARSSVRPAPSNPHTWWSNPRIAGSYRGDRPAVIAVSVGQTIRQVTCTVISHRAKSCRNQDMLGNPADPRANIKHRQSPPWLILREDAVYEPC